jgi:DNA-binding NtrC family response regulator
MINFWLIDDDPIVHHILKRSLEKLKNEIYSGINFRSFLTYEQLNNFLLNNKERSNIFFIDAHLNQGYNAEDILNIINWKSDLYISTASLNEKEISDLIKKSEKEIKQVIIKPLSLKKISEIIIEKIKNIKK